MGHTIQDKQKLINRVRRIRGQVEAIEKALETEQDCQLVLNTIAACRGALNGLLTEVMEEHIRSHIGNAVDQTNRSEAIDQLVDLLKAYIK